MSASRSLRRVAFVVAPLAFVGLLLASSRAGAVDAPADTSPVVVKIGDRTVRASELRKALAGVPAFELLALGTTKIDVLHKYVDEAVVRELLVAEAAKKRGALADRGVQLQLMKALAGAVVRKELGGLGGPADVPIAEVQAYYDAHAAEYKSPERVRLWHLVVATKAEAEAALTKVLADPTREGWPKLVSEISLDPGTRKSSGDLGFVSADGKTTEPKVVVPKELATAGFALKDGEIGKTVVQSPSGFHVLWRKGSTPAMIRSLTEEAATIRELLFEQKREKAYKALVERLRTQAKVETDESLLPLPTLDVGARPVPRPAPGQPTK